MAKHTEGAVKEPVVDDGDYLTADAILASDDAERLVLSIPEWGGKVLFMSMSAQDAREFVDAIKGPSSRNALGLLVIRSARRKDGTPLFDDTQLGQLMRKSQRVLRRLEAPLMELNGINPEAPTLAKND